MMYRFAYTTGAEDITKFVYNDLCAIGLGGHKIMNVVKICYIK